MKSKIEALELLKELNNYILDNEIDCNGIVIDESTRLIGSSGLLDSIDLVGWIVHIENYLNERYNSNLNLMSDQAMSRFTSPFVSIESLTRFVNQLSNDGQ